MCVRNWGLIALISFLWCWMRTTFANQLDLFSYGHSKAENYLELSYYRSSRTMKSKPHTLSTAMAIRSKGSILKGIMELVGNSCWSTCNANIWENIKNCSKINNKLTATFTLPTDAGWLEPQYSSICLYSIIFKHLISTMVLNYALEFNYQYCRYYIKPNKSIEEIYLYLQFYYTT